MEVQTVARQAGQGGSGGERPAHVADLRLTLLISLQVFLAAVVCWAYELETRAVYQVMAAAAIGFPIHALLPLRFRLPFFTLLSWAAIVWVVGWAEALWLGAVGGVLIAICHLPLALRTRVVVLLAVGGILAGARAGMLPGPWSHAVWPILGSMFMFRIALYLHSLKHDGLEQSWTRTVAYFFMLPNVAFPLFPVVDHTTFAKTHYDRPANEIYETGIQWIARGLIQLLLYRVVYLHVVIPAGAVTDLGDLVRFMLGTFLLYLRVSGQFHLIIGIVHIFGFRLPETHHLYYLSTGFTDFWRRINIYWKDFMMKLVYYPSFFRLRRYGARRALGLATVVVFFTTWLLHSYQWFWLQGGFPLTAPDLLFWGLLGVFVLRAALAEAEAGRDRSLGKRGWSPRLAYRTVRTFIALCLLWSLWSAESIIEWVFMLGAAAHADVVDIAWVSALLVGGVAVAGRAWGTHQLVPAVLPWYRRPALHSGLGLAGLALLAVPGIQAFVGGPAAASIASIQTARLNTADAALQHKGYYEKLDQGGQVGAQVWAVLGDAPPEWQRLDQVGILRDRGDDIMRDLEPNRAVEWNGATFTTNSWGMRDREYDLVKPPETIRIALLAPSHAMGNNVSDGETFETLFEDRLNGEFGGAGVRFEVLNFSVDGFSPIQQTLLLEQRVLQFDPDVVLYVVAPSAALTTETYLLSLAPLRQPQDSLIAGALANAGLDHLTDEGLPVPFAAARRLAGSLGMRTRMPWAEAEVRVRGLGRELVEAAVHRFDRVARDHGIQPVLLALDVVNYPFESATDAIIVAQGIGMPVLDLQDVYGGGEVDRLRVAPWDNHPNAAAHELIADRLFGELLRRPELLRVEVRADLAIGQL